MNSSRYAVASVATVSAVFLYWLRKRRTLHEQLFDVREERVIKRVLFCRHGQGVHNLRDEQGKLRHHLLDPELTLQGITEARAIFCRELPGRADFKPQIVFVSPLQRTLQTATEAMAARPDGHTCPMMASEVFREHNNRNACNHRRPIQEAHFTAFPAVDFSEVTVDGPPSASEWAEPYKAAFGILRDRTRRALNVLTARSEERIAVFCHGTFLRAVISELLQLGPHHAAKTPKTGEALEVLLIQTPTGGTYWELDGNKTDGHEVLRLAFRDESGAERSERDPALSAVK